MAKKKPTRYASAFCQYCGYEHRVIIDTRGEKVTEVAAQAGLGLHEANCPKNPNRGWHESLSTPPESP